MRTNSVQWLATHFVTDYFLILSVKKYQRRFFEMGIFWDRRFLRWAFSEMRIFWDGHFLRWAFSDMGIFWDGHFLRYQPANCTHLSVGSIGQFASRLHILYIPVITDRRKNVRQDRQHEPKRNILIVFFIWWIKKYFKKIFLLFSPSCIITHPRTSKFFFIFGGSKILKFIRCKGGKSPFYPHGRPWTHLYLYIYDQGGRERWAVNYIVTKRCKKHFLSSLDFGYFC